MPANNSINSGGLRVDSVRSFGSGDSSSELQSAILMGNSSPKTSGKSLGNLSLRGSPDSRTQTMLFGGNMRRRKIVEWIQKQPVPRSLRRFKGAGDSDDDDDTLFLITGLDRVMFGTMSAADAILIAGTKPPRYLWYMLSGAICDVIQFCIDVILHVVFHIQDASVCWALGFMLSIVFRHTSHRYLVFGDYVGGYRASLTRMYAGYSVIIVLSTIFNIFMTKVAETSHYVAWILTLLWTGIANYFILKKLWSFGGPSSSVGSSSASAMSPPASTTMNSK